MATKVKNEKAGESKLAAMLFHENEVWPNMPWKQLGRPITKRERERILGYGRRGV